MESEILGSGAIDTDVTLAIGCFASIGRDRLADLLVDFGRIAPDVDVGVHEMPRAALLPALVAGELDLVVMPARPLTDLPFRKLWQDWPMVAMAHDHPLASKSQLDVADVANETFLISRQAHAGEMHRFLAQRIASDAPPPAVLCNMGLPRLLDRVASGREVALVPASWPASDDMMLRPLAQPTAGFTVAAYWRDVEPERPLSELLSVLTNFGGRSGSRAT